MSEATFGGDIRRRHFSPLFRSLRKATCTHQAYLAWDKCLFRRLELKLDSKLFGANASGQLIGMSSVHTLQQHEFVTKQPRKRCVLWITSTTVLGHMLQFLFFCLLHTQVSIQRSRLNRLSLARTTQPAHSLHDETMPTKSARGRAWGGSMRGGPLTRAPQIGTHPPAGRLARMRAMAGPGGLS